MSLCLLTGRKNNSEMPTVIYKKERTSQSGGKWYTYCTKVASKDKDGNWDNAFIDLMFRKEDADKITNKCKIVIRDSFPMIDKYNDKVTIKWFISDFTVVEQGEGVPTQNNNTSLNSGSSDDFMTIPNSVDEELPFGG